MSDFSDRPLVAGSLIGLRAFGVDQYGRLFGPSVTQVFRPGENEAECRKGDVVSFSALSFPHLSYDPLTMSVTVGHAAGPPEKAKPALEHSVGGLTCTCGFYAYFDGKNDYKQANNVAALIEGYGVVTVGSRGFRAAKARLVALVEPKAAVAPLTRERLHANYPDVPLYATRREAVEAHPLTPPPIPSPDDDAFWTMAVKR